MGIRGLSTYINQNASNFLEPYQLHDTDLVIDGVNVYCNFYRDTDTHLGAYGGQYDIFAEAVKNFFESLVLCKIRPIIILDSVDTLTKAQYVRKFGDKINNYNPGESCAVQHLLKDVFMDVLKSLKIKCVQTIMEADETMAAVAKGLDCPILSQDGDFYIQGTKFIHWNTLNKIPRVSGDGDNKKFWLSCQMYSIKKFCRKFGNVDESLLPLGLTILGQKDGRGRLDADMIEPFVQKITSKFSSRLQNFHQSKIEKIFKWLATFSSLNGAVSNLLSYVEIRHRPKVREDIEKSIGELGVGSPLALRALELPEEIIQKILRENNRKLLVFQGNTGISTKQEVKSHLSGGDVTDNYEYTEQELIDMSPKWLIDDLSKGKIRALPLELMMFSAATLKPLNDDSAYPSTWKACVPIVKVIYGLICSLRDNTENVLELYFAKDKRIIKEEIKVTASSVDFRDMKELEIAERKKIIDEALGVKGEDLQGIPEEWKLYVATMVFWMKQEVLPKKIDAHVFSVIMAMLIGVIDEKIGIVRSQRKFDTEFGDAYGDILRQSGCDKRGMKDLTVEEVMEVVTKEECIAAAPFFIDFYQQRQYNRGPSTVIVHTFTQFHVCLKTAIVLNSILDYPYCPVPVHKFYNGLLFHKLFEAFSKENDVDSYVSEKLENSPAILKIFQILKGIVLTLLNRKV